MSLPRPIPAPRTKRGRLTKPNIDADTTTQVNPDTDFNLSALITSVERDIWVLEQLEKNSSSPKPDELPVPVTAELLDLPGYRPKTGAKKGNAAINTHVDDNGAPKLESLFQTTMSTTT